jgi:hypothetical protein
MFTLLTLTSLVALSHGKIYHDLFRQFDLLRHRFAFFFFFLALRKKKKNDQVENLKGLRDDDYFIAINGCW